MVILAGLLLACPTPSIAQSVSGPAEATDGDSLSLSGIRVRLFGIDAPEARQTCDRDRAVWACGADARTRLTQLVEGRSVSCESQGVDQYSRMVAICRTGSVDLADAMVAAGLATAFTQYSDAYVETETRAKELKLG
ncbi:MAG: thermonuclease family protein, partial [Pseudomonadota bacterium]|nr:thermonuclease family protein [Pseudomonadota bacterium]